MAEALLITRTDLVRLTALGGNVDTDKFIQFIKIAQDIHIQGYLGTRLFDRIKDDIENDTLTNPYLNLLEKYIKPMLIHWAMVEYLPFAAYNIANKGVYKHTAENSDSVEKTEVDYLVEKERDIAQHYTQRFLDHMSNNSADYPEYNTTSGEDMYPNKNNFFKGWYL
jgi:hypothetical protein